MSDKAHLSPSCPPTQWIERPDGCANLILSEKRPATTIKSQINPAGVINRSPANLSSRLASPLAPV